MNGYYLRSQKKKCDSRPLSLSQMLENCSINRTIKEEDKDGKETDSYNTEKIMCEDKDLKRDWMKTYMDIKLILSKVDTIAITSAINRDYVQRSEIHTTKGFYNYYKKAFNFWCEGNSSKRSGHIYIGVAIQLWILLVKQKCFFFDIWIAFLVERGVQFISKDQWNLFLEFCEEFNPKGFDSYDFKGAWPTLMDSFVEFYKMYH